MHYPCCAYVRNVEVGLIPITLCPVNEVVLLTSDLQEQFISQGEVITKQHRNPALSL